LIVVIGGMEFVVVTGCEQGSLDLRMEEERISEQREGEEEGGHRPTWVWGRPVPPWPLWPSTLDRMTPCMCGVLWCMCVLPHA